MRRLYMLLRISASTQNFMLFTVCMALVYQAASPAYRTHEQRFKPHQMTRIGEMQSPQGRPPHQQSQDMDNVQSDN